MVQMFSCPISSARDGELHHRLSTIEGQTGTGNASSMLMLLCDAPCCSDVLSFLNPTIKN